MFSFAFWVISTQKCEVVNFPKFESAGVPVRLLKYLGMSILLRAHVPWTHTHDVHVHHDITRFAHDANHVTSVCIPFVPCGNEVA